jgi:hypothetical protein
MKIRSDKITGDDLHNSSDKNILHNAHITLDFGNYRGFDYFITSGGLCPCAYIAIDNVKLISILEDFVHGGITYTGKFNKLKINLNTDKPLMNGETEIIGWDYGHYGDRIYALDTNKKEIKGITNSGKTWTVPMIKKEVYSAIRKIYSEMEVKDVLKASIAMNKKIHGGRK